MKVSCPHCAQRLDLDAGTLESLLNAEALACPVCGGAVPLPQSVHGGAEPARKAGWQALDVETISCTFDSRYQIKRLLGRGGMGAVYEGFDTRLDRRVAIKILPAETSSNSAALLRFEREAKAMAALDHPNIVHIHDYGQTSDGNPYFIMEFIDGMDVHHLRHSGQLDLSGALDLVSQVCSALQYAHSRGIVHRDIKPGNILVTREGVAKVADFGLAKVLGAENQPRHDPTLTRSGTAVGTPDYMAPEQFEGSHVDHRADIYSLGVMLYDLLTGSPPRGAWPPPSQRVQIDVRLDEIVLRALQQNPSARYQAASEVRADIDSVKSSTGGGPLPPGRDPAPLPSQITASPAIQNAPAASRSPRSTPSQTPPIHADEAANASGGLGATVLILGLIAIAIVGGLAFYLANRQPLVTHINQELVENTTIHRDIPPGMTPKDLEGVGDIHSHDGGFIGISMEAVAWDEAQQLAKRTGAKVLPVDPTNPAWPAHHDWLRGHFTAPLTLQAWVSGEGGPRLLDQQKITEPGTETPSVPIRHKALLHWPQATPIATGTPFELPTQVRRDQAGEGPIPSASTNRAREHAVPEAISNLDYGLLIHYGMQTFTGLPSSGKQEGTDAAHFAPADVDVQSWIQLAKDGGMTFVVLNVKHSTGFRLWDAPFDDYDIGGSGFQRDLLAEFIAECNAEGITPGANYVVTDVHREGGYLRQLPVSASHMDLIRKELDDLLTRYPRLRVLALGHLSRMTSGQAAEIRTWIRTRNPSCVVLDDEASGRSYQPLSTVKGWFLTSPQTELPSAETLFGDIQKWRNQGIPVLLNVGPARDGRIPRDQKDLVLKMARQISSTRADAVSIRSSGNSQTATGTPFKQEIDLLALTDPTKDRVMPGTMGMANDWEKSDGVLRYKSDGKSGKIVPPVAVNATSYEVEFYYRRLDGNGWLNLSLPIGGQILPIALDSAGKRPIHGKDGEALPQSLPDEGRYVIRHDVGVNGQPDQIIIQLNGTMLSDWKGRVTPYLKDLKGREEHPEFPRQPLLSMFCGTDHYEFTEWKLRVFAGEAKVLRGTPGATSKQVPAALSSNLLPWINTDGKTIEAEFVRLDDESVVIRKDGKEFTIPLAKLAPDSRKQALNLVDRVFPAPE